MTRRILAVAALAAAALPVVPANALPPECERYGDKPCIVLCEIAAELEEQIQKLILDPLPVPPPICR